MDALITKITAVIASFFVWIGVIICPANVEGVFSDETTVTEKSEFDEGEFVMGRYDIVVAPNGNDLNDGTLENPFRTLEGVKEKLKSVDAHGKNITVWFREGTYNITETVEFTADDRQNVLYRSYPDEKVRFSGAEEISDWRETTVNGVRAFVSDVEINGEGDYFRSLFKGDKRLSRPQYPKEGVFTIADPKTDEAVASEWGPDFFTHYLAFYAHKDQILDFANPTDVEVKIMHFWCDEHLPVHSVDPETGRIETSQISSMTVRVDDNFVYENVKEALSLPGEWYLDRAEKKLYYIPEEGDTVENTILYAGKTEQLLSFSNAKNISFQGIDFINTDFDRVDGTHFPASLFGEDHPLYKNVEYGGVHPQAAFETPAAINVAASSGVNFTDCRFENISYSAVKFDKGANACNVTSCRFNEIGGNAVFIHGDFVIPATTRDVNVRDCHISYYGRIFNNAIGVLLTHAEDCDIANNEIHDGWYTGVSVGWNWGYSDHPTNNIRIQDNLIYNIGNGWLSDMGGIYTLGIQPDTVISGNIIRNVGCDDGKYGYGGWGIYLDEGSSEMLVENNLAYDCSSQTFHQHYGRDNVIRNNIFAFGGEGQFIITKNEEHNSLFLENNILVGYDTPMYVKCALEDQFVDNGNLYWDYKHGGNVYSGDSSDFFDRKYMIQLTAKGYYNNAVFENPLFRDAENRDFTLAKNSPAIEAGFKPFAYDAGTVTLMK